MSRLKLLCFSAVVVVDLWCIKGFLLLFVSGLSFLSPSSTWSSSSASSSSFMASRGVIGVCLNWLRGFPSIPKLRTRDIKWTRKIIKHYNFITTHLSPAQCQLLAELLHQNICVYELIRLLLVQVGVLEQISCFLSC